MSKQVAPSATPGETAPASVAVPASPAPSAATPKPITLADYAALASAALVGEPPQPTSPEPGPESPPETSAESTAPPPVAEAELSPETPDADADAAEPTAEDQAQWTEGEKRLHAALVKERESRKAARADVKALRSELDAIKSKLEQQPTANAPALPAVEPPDVQAAASPSAPPRPAMGSDGALKDCNTFEAVDARAMQAATVEAESLRLQQTLTRQGREAVVERLTRQGVKEISGIPIADASEEVLADHLANCYEGARLIQLQAEPRKRFLYQQAQSYQEAAKIVPELKDPKHERSQRFAQIVRETPWITQTGPNWPQVVATFLVGQEQLTTRTSSTNGQEKPVAAATPVKAAPAPPTPRPAPGVPRTTAAALPKASEYDTAAERVRSGKASFADIAAMATASLAAGSTR